uniref:Uncharacterized protein n=1 Tax=Cannabis sativa TaxID=3483 RepID=A0A803Q2N9_CANSA
MTSKAQKSKTPQDPTVTFEAKLIESKVRSIGSYVGEVLRSCGIKYGKGWRVRSVAPGEFSCFPPERVIREEGCITSESSGIGAWSLEYIRDGVVLPLKDYYKVFCNYLEIAPLQLILNSYRIMASLKVLYQILQWECPTPLEILYFYSVKACRAKKQGLDMNYESLLSSPLGSTKAHQRDLQRIKQLESELRTTVEQREVVVRQWNESQTEVARVMNEAEEQKKSHKTELEGAKKRLRISVKFMRKFVKSLTRRTKSSMRLTRNLKGLRRMP